MRRRAAKRSAACRPAPFGASPGATSQAAEALLQAFTQLGVDRVHMDAGTGASMITIDTKNDETMVGEGLSTIKKLKCRWGALCKFAHGTVELTIMPGQFCHRILARWQFQNSNWGARWAHHASGGHQASGLASSCCCCAAGPLQTLLLRCGLSSALVAPVAAHGEPGQQAVGQLQACG